MTLGVLMLVAASAGAGVGGDNFNAQVTLTSDYVFRGVTQTQGEPAIQGGFDFGHDSGFFAGIWGSNVDLPGGTSRDGSDRLELDLYLGVDRELAPDWSGVVTLTRYDYPRADYLEALLGLRWADQVSAFVAYTDDAFGTGHSSMTYELSGRYPAPQRLDLWGGVGYSDLSELFGENYSFWSFGVSRTLSRFTLGLGYFGTDGSARSIFGESAENRLVLSVTAAVR